MWTMTQVDGFRSVMGFACLLDLWDEMELLRSHIVLKPSMNCLLNMGVTIGASPNRFVRYGCSSIFLY